MRCGRGGGGRATCGGAPAGGGRRDPPPRAQRSLRWRRPSTGSRSSSRRRGEPRTQELYAAQQQVADAYRAEAARSLNKMAELEQTHAATAGLLRTVRRRPLRDRHSRHSCSSRVSSRAPFAEPRLTTERGARRLHRGLDELRAELRDTAARRGEEACGQAARPVQRRSQAAAWVARSVSVRVRRPRTGVP